MTDSARKSRDDDCNSKTQREIEEDRELTRALKDTFPASDPVSIGDATGPEVAHGGGPARPGEPVRDRKRANVDDDGEDEDPSRAS